MKNKLLYILGTVSITSIASLSLVSCVESTEETKKKNDNNKTEKNEQDFNVTDLTKQNQLINLFASDFNKQKFQIDIDTSINNKFKFELEIKKVLKENYSLTNKQLSYISIETPFSQFSLGNYRTINIGIKVGNEEKNKSINLKIGQIAKMIDLNVDLQEIANKAIKARELNIKNGATKEESGYLSVPALENNKNIIAVKVNVNGQYVNSDFVQYDTLTNYEADKAKYTINQFDDEKSSKQNSRMLYNKAIKTPILVSLRKSAFEWTSNSDDNKIKNSFDYLRIAANLSTREILREVWNDIKNYAHSKISSSASLIIAEIKKITNLNNTIRDSNYKQNPSYIALNNSQKLSLDSLIKDFINPFIEQLSDNNVACVKKLILKLKSIPNYIKIKHNEIVNNLSSLLENNRSKKFKIHNLKFYKAWKDSKWTIYDDSKKVRYSRYLVDVVDNIPLIFDTTHSKYVNPLAYAIGDSFVNIIENSLVNMPLLKALLKGAHSVHPFEKFINNFFNRFKNTNLLNVAKLDVSSSGNYNGTIVNYIKKLLTDSFIFNDKFIKNFPLFNNANLNAKEWYNIDLKNMINSFVPNAWGWFKTWETQSGKSIIDLLTAIKKDFNNNKINKPLSIININIHSGNTKLYSKKVNLNSFFNRDILSYNTFLDSFNSSDNVDDIKERFKTSIKSILDEKDVFNHSIKLLLDKKIKFPLEKVHEELGWVEKLAISTYLGSDIKEFVYKSVKPIFEEFSPVLKDLGNTIFVVINGEGGIHSGIDIDYISSLILKIEWLLNKYRAIEIMGEKIFLKHIPDLTDKLYEINSEVIKYSKWIEPINNGFASIKL